MIPIQFLVDWAIRSSILILCGGLLLCALRVKDPSIRLAAWVVMLCGSLAIPMLAPVLPRMALAVPGPAAGRALPRPAIRQDYEESSRRLPGLEVVTPKPVTNEFKRFDWAGAALSLYVLIRPRGPHASAALRNRRLDEFAPAAGQPCNRAGD
ncbi:MAG TPA: hypothetical protein VHZ74_18795 [Bryobacteraceae bacterium]|jgi:hypothetical protein|nr:hypothetical protein [Bryobacteraceae bacterium]